MHTKTLLTTIISFIMAVPCFTQPLDIVWSMNYGASDCDEAGYQIIRHEDGFIIGGQAAGEGEWDFLLFKAASNGDSILYSRYGGGRGEWCPNVIAIQDGDFIASGCTWNANDMDDCD